MTEARPANDIISGCFWQFTFCCFPQMLFVVLAPALIYCCCCCCHCFNSEFAAPSTVIPASPTSTLNGERSHARIDATTEPGSQATLNNLTHPSTMFAPIHVAQSVTAEPFIAQLYTLLQAAEEEKKQVLTPECRFNTEAPGGRRVPDKLEVSPTPWKQGDANVRAPNSSISGINSAPTSLQECSGMSLNGIIGWGDNGSVVVIHNPPAFACLLLPLLLRPSHLPLPTAAPARKHAPSSSSASFSSSEQIIIAATATAGSPKVNTGMERFVANMAAFGFKRVSGYGRRQVLEMAAERERLLAQRTNGASLDPLSANSSTVMLPIVVPLAFRHALFTRNRPDLVAMIRRHGAAWPLPVQQQCALSSTTTSAFAVSARPMRTSKLEFTDSTQLDAQSSLADNYSLAALAVPAVASASAPLVTPTPTSEQRVPTSLAETQSTTSPGVAPTKKRRRHSSDDEDSHAVRGEVDAERYDLVPASIATTASVTPASAQPARVGAAMLTPCRQWLHRSPPECSSSSSSTASAALQPRSLGKRRRTNQMLGPRPATSAFASKDFDALDVLLAAASLI